MLFTLIALRLGTLFQRYPLIQQGLQIVGVLYLLYLAWRIASAPPPQFDTTGDARPLTLWQAAAFQFVNPKVWVMGLTLMASFLPTQGTLWANALGLAVFMELVALPCISLWAGFGIVIARFLKTPRAWRLFNVTMGLMTAACVVFIVK